MHLVINGAILKLGLEEFVKFFGRRLVQSIDSLLQPECIIVLWIHLVIQLSEYPVHTIGEAFWSSQDPTTWRRCKRWGSHRKLVSYRRLSNGVCRGETMTLEHGRRLFHWKSVEVCSTFVSSGTVDWGTCWISFWRLHAQIDAHGVVENHVKAVRLLLLELDRCQSLCLQLELLLFLKRR